MKKNQSIIKPKKSSLKKEITALLIGFDEPTIHHVRLQVKKLKAALQLIKKTHKSFKTKKIYRIIRPIHQDLGAIRDLQIQQTLFNESNNDKAFPVSFQRKFKQFLTNELLEYQTIAREHIDDAAIKAFDKMKKHIDEAVKDVARSDFNAYFKTRIRKLKKKLNALDFSEKKMHNLRMLIKEIKFNSAFNPQIAHERLAKKKIDMAFLEALQDALGSCQDNVVLKEKLTQQGGLLAHSTGEKNALVQFKTSVDAHNELIKSKIKKILEKGTPQYKGIKSLNKMS
jgi:CHAD domain-containing protein